MCGFIGFSGNLDNKEAILQKMMDRIVHRGPDMGGMYTDDGIALGFRRLSILDLSDAGAQPMANEDKSVVVVFNGEIYNFMELRRELEAKGHTFHCGADTEVLIHGYEEYGTELIYPRPGRLGAGVRQRDQGLSRASQIRQGRQRECAAPLSDAAVFRHRGNLLQGRVQAARGPLFCV